MGISETLKLLIIDDEIAIHRFVRATVGRVGSNALSAWTATEGLRLVEGQNPDVVLVDLHLPDIDNMEVIRAIRQRSSATVIVMSNRWTEEDREAALFAGADEYLLKPFFKEELIDRIDNRYRSAKHSLRELNLGTRSWQTTSFVG